MSASSADLKCKLTDEQVRQLAESGRRNCLFFSVTSNPPVEGNEWFIRVSSTPGHVTLGIKRDGVPGWLRITDDELTQVLNGNSVWVKADGGKLELQDLLVPVENRARFASPRPSFTTVHSLNEADIKTFIDKEYTSFLIFENASEPEIKPEQWFLRRSKEIDQISLGLYVNGKLKIEELTTAQLDELLSGKVLPGIGYKLELSNMVVPETAKMCLPELKNKFPRFFEEPGTNIGKHPALQNLTLGW